MIEKNPVQTEQLQEVEKNLERLEAKRRELVRNGALEAQIIPISIKIRTMEAEIKEKKSA